MDELVKLGLAFFVVGLLAGCSKGFQVGFTITPVSQIEHKQGLDQDDYEDKSWF